MGRPKKIVEEVINEVPEVVEAPVKKASGKTSAQVLSRAGALARTYTLEVHGENFETLAEGYAKKIGGSVR